jgi:hypothetical protein
MSFERKQFANSKAVQFASNSPLDANRKWTNWAMLNMEKHGWCLYDIQQQFENRTVPTEFKAYNYTDRLTGEPKTRYYGTQHESVVIRNVIYFWKKQNRIMAHVQEFSPTPPD